jgi:hypothetical protein
MIERVGHDLFTPLSDKQLQIVDFRSNRCIARWGNNETSIRALIADLKVMCPFDDEDSWTTTTTATTTESTTEGLTCGDGDIQELVCKLKEEVVHVKMDMIDAIDELQQQLNQNNDELRVAMTKIEELQDEMTAKDKRMKEIEATNERLADLGRLSENKKKGCSGLRKKF